MRRELKGEIRQVEDGTCKEHGSNVGKRLASLVIWLLIFVTLLLWFKNILDTFRTRTPVSSQVTEVLIFLPDETMSILVPITLQVPRDICADSKHPAELLKLLFKVHTTGTINPFNTETDVIAVNVNNGEVSVNLSRPDFVGFSQGSMSEELALQAIEFTLKYNSVNVKHIKLMSNGKVISTEHLGPIDLDISNEYINRVDSSISEPMMVFYMLRNSELLVPLTFDSSRDPISLMRYVPEGYASDLIPLLSAYPLEFEGVSGGTFKFKLTRVLSQRATLNLLKALRITFQGKVKLHGFWGKLVDYEGSFSDNSLIGINLVELELK